MDENEKSARKKSEAEAKFFFSPVFLDFFHKPHHHHHHLPSFLPSFLPYFLPFSPSLPFIIILILSFWLELTKAAGLQATRNAMSCHACQY